MLLLVNGDVMGSSGITSPLVLQPKSTWKSQPWKFVFTASFIVTANVYQRFVDPDVIVDTAATRSLSTPGWILAGLLVGFGTKLGNGCTSGHGICGLGRFSKRSFAAVGTFMAVAAATATSLSQQAVQNSLSFLFLDEPSSGSNVSSVAAVVLATVSSAVALWSLRRNSSKKSAGAAVGGAIFAVGLAVGKMILPSKLTGFVDLSGLSKGTYDLSLAFVMGSGVLMSLIGYQLKHRIFTKPVCASDYNSVPTKTDIDSQLLVGSAVFGLGWGLGGVCPGPALFHAAVGATASFFAWMPAFFVGSYLAAEYKLLLSNGAEKRQDKVS